MLFRTLSVMVLTGCIFGTLRADGHEKELAEVKAGTRTEAKASWWGFDKKDSTKALQRAIDSGVKKLIVDNTGSDWIVGPVKLTDNQEILFEKGVIVSAKKDAFKGPQDSLFEARAKENIVLKGEDGVVFRMNKADYQDSSRYKKAEWRNTITLRSCENVTIQNLTLLSSGGDGIYVGILKGNQMNYCKNILIDDVLCDDHNRQGISVVSAENLTLRNCVFKNTHGAAPEAGIDFEPNYSNERLINCVVENCSFTGNGGSGIDFYLKTELPLSIFIRDCKIEGNYRGIRYKNADNWKREKYSDKIEFVNCVIGHSATENISIQGGNTVFVLKNCNIDNTDNIHPAVFITERHNHSDEGFAQFENVTVRDNNMKREPVSIVSYLNHPRFRVMGNVKLIRPGMPATAFDYSGKTKPAYEGEFKSAGPLELSKLIVPKTSAVSSSGEKSIIPIRGQVKFIQFAGKGQKILIDVLCVSTRKDRSISMRLLSPKGGEVMKFEVPPVCDLSKLAAYNNTWKQIEFTPGETGAYILERTDKNNNLSLIRSKAHGNGYLVEDELHVMRARGKLFFQVPAGVKNIKIEVLGELNEPVSASLLDPRGKSVCDLTNVTITKLLSFRRTDTAKSEIWAVKLNASDDAYIRMGEGLVGVLAEKPEYLPLLP